MTVWSDGISSYSPSWSSAIGLGIVYVGYADGSYCGYADGDVVGYDDRLYNTPTWTSNTDLTQTGSIWS